VKIELNEQNFLKRHYEQNFHKQEERISGGKNT